MPAATLRPFRRPIAILFVIAAAVLIAACGGGGKKPTSSSSPITATTTTSTTQVATTTSSSTSSTNTSSPALTTTTTSPAPTTPPTEPIDMQDYLDSIPDRVHRDDDICAETDGTPIPVLSMTNQLLVRAESADAGRPTLTALLGSRPFTFSDDPGSSAPGVLRVIVPDLDPDQDFMAQMKKVNDESRKVDGPLISLNVVYAASQVYRFHPFSPPVEVNVAPGPEPAGGKGRTIAVFDSPYPNVPLAAAAVVPPSGGAQVTYPSNPPKGPYPAIGHGPFVASLIKRYASGAAVEPYGVAEVDSEGIFIDIDDVQHVMSDAFAEKAIPNEPDFHVRAPDIINLSFGGAGCDLVEPAVFGEFLNRLATPSEWEDDAITPVIVAAAGNSSGDLKEYPAAFSVADTSIYPSLADHVVAVGSMSPGQTVPDCFSNVGTWVNIWAPGADQVSYYPYGSGWASWSGTSFATARVSAMLADVATTNSDSVEAVWPKVASGSISVPDMPITQITTPGTC